MSGWKKFKDLAPGVLKQLALEAIGPAFTSAIWTIGTTPAGSSTMTYVAAGTTSFAVSAYLWAQLWRIIKQQKQERGLSTITNKVDQLLQRLDDRVKDLIGYSTGGTSQVVLDIHDGYAKDGVRIDVVNAGQYPIYDMELKLMQVMMGHMKPGKVIDQSPLIRVLQPNKCSYAQFKVQIPRGTHASYTLLVDKRNGATFHSLVLHRLEDGELLVAKEEHGVETIPENFPGVDPANPNFIFLRP